MRYVLEFDVDVLEWILSECHSDATARERINAKLNQAMRYLAKHGPSVGLPHVRGIKGHDNLYEVRVEDETGWYRVFFGVGRIRADGSKPIALSYALVKHERDIPDRIYDEAAAAVRAHLAEIDQ